MSNSNETNNSDSRNIKTKIVITVLFIIVSVVVSLYYFNFNSHLLKNEIWKNVFQNLSEDTGNWGTFGDYFGGILNPFIAALALYLIYETYKLQKTELEATRSLLKISTDAQKHQIELAALTALLSSNLTKIGLLESEKLSLLESELRNPKPKEHVDYQDLMRSALNGDYGKHIKDRRDYIKDEINELRKKNIELEAQIEDFSKK